MLVKLYFTPMNNDGREQQAQLQRSTKKEHNGVGLVWPETKHRKSKALPIRIGIVKAIYIRYYSGRPRWNRKQGYLTTLTRHCRDSTDFQFYLLHTLFELRLYSKF